MEALCRQAGIATERRNIPTIKNRNRKNGQGDLVLKRVGLGGQPDLILDVAFIHSSATAWLTSAAMGSSATPIPPSSSRRPRTPRCAATATRSGVAGAARGSLPPPTPPSPRRGAAGAWDAFLPQYLKGGSMASFCGCSTSSPTAGLSAGSRDPGITPETKPSSSVGQYFWHTLAVIGHAAARAVAQRVRMAEHTLRRSRAGPHTQDDFLYPPTAPLGL